MSARRLIGDAGPSQTQLGYHSRHRLVDQYDKEYGVYDDLTFVMKRFRDYLERNNIPWPTLGEGRKAATAKRPDQLDLDDDTFKEMGELFPQVEKICDSCVTPYHSCASMIW